MGPDAASTSLGTEESPSHTLYLADVHAVLHSPPSPGPHRTPVLLCPPFGWEELCSYRSLRAWADELARAGHPALRIDLPSTGESAGSPRDPGRLEAWTEAVADAAGWLARSTGHERVAVVGIGLGGLLAGLALDRGAPIGDLALWGVPARGRMAVRELRAFALLKSEGVPGGAPSKDAGEAMEVGGFVLTPETLETVSAIDLTDIDELGRDRRAFLLGRDGVAPDRRLIAHLESGGAEVSTDDGIGWAAMMADPHAAVAPRQAIAAMIAWLEATRETTGPPEAEGDEAPASDTTLELTVDGVAVRETPWSLAQPFGRLSGTLVEPAAADPAATCALFLNAGAIRRIGPNRLWVEASRRAAATGMASLRLDVEGLGDSDGDATEHYALAALNVPELVAQVRAALDDLHVRGHGPSFMLMGLCSGGYQSFQAALGDDRVRAACLVNAGALFWHDELTTARDAGQLRLLARPSTWTRVARGYIEVGRARQLVRAALASLWRRLRGVATGDVRSEVEEAFDTLRDDDKRLVLAFSGNEPLLRELRQAGIVTQLERWPNVEIASLPGAVHTLRPLEAQRGLLDLFERLFAEELGRVPAPVAAASR